MDNRLSPQVPVVTRNNFSLSRITSIAESIWKETLNLVFPPRCLGCGKVDTVICTGCLNILAHTHPPNSVQPLPSLTAITSTAVHKGVIREAVQALKYDNTRLIAVPLGTRLTEHVRAKGWQFDMIIPVPLHTHRLKERGYNQSELLAAIVADETMTPMVSVAVERTRLTRSQVGLSATERRRNLLDAFIAQPDLVSGKSILLIDDVYTTGATLGACAQALFDAGALSVYGLTVTAAQS
jgi:competence protein ComFC